MSHKQLKSLCNFYCFSTQTILRFHTGLSYKLNLGQTLYEILLTFSVHSIMLSFYLKFGKLEILYSSIFLQVSSKVPLGDTVPFVCLRINLFPPKPVVITTIVITLLFPILALIQTHAYNYIHLPLFYNHEMQRHIYLLLDSYNCI